MEFVVHGKPVPKQRPRMTRYGAVYTPAETIRFEKLVAKSAISAGARPVSGPVSVELETVFPIPKSWTKARKAAAEGQPHTQRPDLDNLVKSVLDGLNGVAFADDSQVHSVASRKRWSSDCGDGLTIIRITH